MVVGLREVVLVAITEVAGLHEQKVQVVAGLELIVRHLLAEELGSITTKFTTAPYPPV
jgi:hypothetical protein